MKNLQERLNELKGKYEGLRGYLEQSKAEGNESLWEKLKEMQDEIKALEEE